MKQIAAIWLFALICCPLRAADSSELFTKSIRPLLANKCFQCHGPDEAQRQAGVRLDLDVADAHEKASLLNRVLERIQSDDPNTKMPPPSVGKGLTENETKLLNEWIASGAKFQEHWAFRPIAKLSSKIDPSISIDSLIDDGLQSAGLRRTPPASKLAWLRRVYIDLIGVFPTWEQVQEFENDSSTEAFEKVVDRLLDSPLYGQRWGKHWLDLARYADTHGGAAIGFVTFPFSYTYRDYVINAFNQDVPYDRFLMEQIAADQMELPENDPRLAALGFLTVGMQYRNFHDVVDDQIDVITRGLMGMTGACARCHDHKFDAIPTKDYYSLYAALSPSSPPSELPVVRAGNTPFPAPEKMQSYLAKLERLKRQHDEMARDQIEIMKHRLRMQFGLYLREMANGTPEQDVATAFLSYRTDDLRPIVINRWRNYLTQVGNDDPVFGIWHQLAQLPAGGFGRSALELVEAKLAETSADAKLASYHSIGGKIPVWNRLVLEAIQAKKPHSMLDVADAYGDLFSKVHMDWLKGLQETSLEAVSSESVVPDDDEKHRIVNSPVYRQLRWHLYGSGTPTEIPKDQAIEILNRTVNDTLDGKRNAIENHHRDDSGSVPRAMVTHESNEERESFVFIRGNHMARGERVVPGFLTALPSLVEQSEATKPGRRRLALAKQIVHTDNPLTRRVIANWIWQQHFGHGIVRTPDNFGTRGTPPSNPRLLDYLAHSFLEDGWSIKKMHRRILLSHTFRQGSIESEVSRTKDPENDLWWRMPKQRLDLEAMRDAMLFASGELDTTPGGRSIDLSASPTIPRRSVYGIINRDIISNLASTFDSANPNACTLRRPDTVVPQQTLFALNSDFVQDRAAQLVKSFEAAKLAGTDDKVTWLYRRLYNRPPTADELATAQRYLVGPGDSNEAGEPNVKRWQSFAHAMLASNEFQFID